MLTAPEIVRSLGGAWALFLGRREGLERLDRSLAGFWRSFLVIILILPINAVSMFAASRLDNATETFDQLFWGGLPVLLVDWIAFPVLLAGAAGALGVKRTYVDYVVARNWAAPLASVLLAVPLVFQGAGFHSHGRCRDPLARGDGCGPAIPFHDHSLRARHGRSRLDRTRCGGSAAVALPGDGAVLSGVAGPASPVGATLFGAVTIPAASLFTKRVNPPGVTNGRNR